MNQIERKEGRKRIYLVLFILALIFIGINLYNANKDKALEVKNEIPSLSEIEPVLAVSEPPVAPEPIPEPIVQPKAPEVPVAPVTQPVTYTGDCSLVKNYSDWPVNVAYAVCMAESTGNVMAHNSGDNHGSCVGSYSLMQVGCFWYSYYGYSSADYYNPQVNIEIAHNIWQRQGGFGAWTTYTRGAYTKYLR